MEKNYKKPPADIYIRCDYLKIAQGSWPKLERFCSEKKKVVLQKFRS